MILSGNVPADLRGYKPVKDEVMAAMLDALQKLEFFELAQPGYDASSYRMGDGHGVVSVSVDDRKWALIFRPMGAAVARSSPIPTKYRDAKVLILSEWNATLHFSVGGSGNPDRTFQIPPPVHTPPERRE